MMNDPMEDSEPYPKPKNANILITGTPGCGKTTLCERVAELTGLRHINVGDLIRDKELHAGRNEEFDCFILDEDKVCDELEEVMVQGGNIIDFHTCDFFPERWFHLVVVLRTSNDVLFPRLEKRGYSGNKIEENVTAEIMQVVLESARESYAPEIVVELTSNDVDEMEANAQRTAQWYADFVQNKTESKTQ